MQSSATPCIRPDPARWAEPRRLDSSRSVPNWPGRYADHSRIGGDITHNARTGANHRPPAYAQRIVGGSILYRRANADPDLLGYFDVARDCSAWRHDRALAYPYIVRNDAAEVENDVRSNFASVRHDGARKDLNGIGNNSRRRNNRIATHEAAQDQPGRAQLFQYFLPRRNIANCDVPGCAPVAAQCVRKVKNRNMLEDPVRLKIVDERDNRNVRLRELEQELTGVTARTVDHRLLHWFVPLNGSFAIDPRPAPC